MSLTVVNEERVSQSQNIIKSDKTHAKPNSIHSECKKTQKNSHEIESCKHLIEMYEDDKKKLLDILKTKNYSESLKMEVTEAKHPIAMGIGYAGLTMWGGGFSVAALGFMEPLTLIGGLAVGFVGAAIAGVAKGIVVNGDMKNTTDKDIQNYIKSEINKIDEKIAEYKEKLRKLEAE